MKKMKIIMLAFTVAILLACSSDSGSDSSTYYIQVYGITNASFCADPSPYKPQNKNFESVISAFENIRALSGSNLLEIESGISEAEAKEFLKNFNWTPKEIDNWLNKLNETGNAMLIGDSNEPSYCAIIVYTEVE